MLVEIFIFLMIVALFFFVLGLFNYKRTESIIFFVVSVVLFGVLMFSGIALETIEPVYNVTGGNYYMSSYVHVDYSMMGINFIFFALSVVFTWIDYLNKFPKQLSE